MLNLICKKDDFGAVQPQVKAEIERMSNFINAEMFITSAYRSGDPKQHGIGLALDLICPSIPLLDFYFAASRFAWKGIGIYPDWELNGKKVGGLHVDLRVNEKRDLWMGVKENGNQVYVALNQEQLKKHGVI